MPESTCPCKIHPLPNDTIIECRRPTNHGGLHEGVLSDYAFPGSRTTISWDHFDRRNYTGDWIECPSKNCILPANHRGNHAT